MDWLTFISGMTKALAWPTAAIVIVVIFREQMAALIGRVTNVTTPLGSINAEAKEAREDAENLPSPDVSIQSHDPEPVEEPIPRPPRFNRPEYRRGLAHAKRLAAVSPRDAVDGAWEIFTSAARSMVESTDDDFRWDEWKPVLANLGMWGLSKEALDVVRSLEDVQRRTGHRPVHEQLSSEAAVDFCEAAERVLNLILSIAIHPSRSAVTRARLGVGADGAAQ